MFSGANEKGPISIYQSKLTIDLCISPSSFFPLNGLSSLSFTIAIKMFNAFFNSTCLSDVKFRVDGKIVPAHKLLLAAKSPVFNAMFCGELAEQEQIILPDCDYEGVLEFLRFLHTEKVYKQWDVNVVAHHLWKPKHHLIPQLVMSNNVF